MTAGSATGTGERAEGRPDDFLAEIFMGTGAHGGATRSFPQQDVDSIQNENCSCRSMRRLAAEFPPNPALASLVASPEQRKRTFDESVQVERCSCNPGNRLVGNTSGSEPQAGSSWGLASFEAAGLVTLPFAWPHNSTHNRELL